MSFDAEAFLSRRGIWPSKTKGKLVSAAYAAGLLRAAGIARSWAEAKDGNPPENGESVCRQLATAIESEAGREG